MTNFVHPQSKPRAFTLVELLTVLGIMSLLAAILFPVFGTVRGRARQASCLSNLKQIGLASSLYIQDNDSYYPYAVDDLDRLYPENWADYPTFATEIPKMQTLPHVLKPYTKSDQIFHCPADIGFRQSDFTDQDIDAIPTSFQAFGTSYYYRTEMAAARYLESQVGRASQINLIFDGAGRWHGTLTPMARRYNVLFADMHAKNISEPQMNEAWGMRATEG